MRTINTEKDMRDFLRDLLQSEFWEWIRAVLKARENAIVAEIGDPKHHSTGRALLNGQFLEVKRLLDFPQNSYAFFEGQLKAAKEPDESLREAIVSKTAFPDVVTH